MKYFCIVLLLLIGCKPSKETTVSSAAAYATHFQYQNGQIQIGQASLPAINATRIICFSSTHVALLNELGLSERIIGVTNRQYIYDPSIREQIKNQTIKEVGEQDIINVEKIIALRPDLILLSYPLSDHLQQSFSKLGISSIVLSEYKENHPLGRAEWIKVIGALTASSAQADSIFTKISRNYQHLKNNCKDVKTKVIAGSAYKGIWYMPASESYMAQFIRDAGGVYPLQAKSEDVSVSLSVEQVYEQFKDADIWINQGAFSDAKSLVAEDERYQLFDAFQKGRLYNFNKRTNEDATLDFYESGIVRPDLLLRDLHMIIHATPNDSLPSLTYYQLLK